MTIVEIKCPLKCRDRKIEDLTKADSSFCLEFSTASGLRLKRQHNYYFQIQEQLYCSGKQEYLFMV